MSKGFRDAPSEPSPLAEILKRAELSSELSPQAREHLGVVSAIAASALDDLEAIRNEVDQLRVEITLRARLLAEATVQFDKLVRSASRGYGTVRQTLDSVREKFASAAAPMPRTAPAEDEPRTE